MHDLLAHQGVDAAGLLVEGNVVAREGGDLVVEAAQVARRQRGDNHHQNQQAQRDAVDLQADGTAHERP